MKELSTINDQSIEWSLYVTKPRDLKHYHNKFVRIYYGNEFCQNLIPTVRELDQVLNFVSKNELVFTFLTPPVTNDGLRGLETLMIRIMEEYPESEIIFNDWGVLKILNEKYANLRPVMGRLLNKMKRGPRLVNLLDILTESSLKHLKSCSIDAPHFSRFLRMNRVERVELDNLLQGILLNLSEARISASLYIPYVYITITRFCLAISCEEHGKEDTVGIFPCSKECQKHTFYLTNPAMPLPLIRRGNTMFFKNDDIPKNLKENNINRIVIEPEVPL
jgi:hypothetical protein